MRSREMTRIELKGGYEPLSKCKSPGYVHMLEIPSASENRPTASGIRQMDIVGVNMGHDSSAALLRDGSLIEAAEEERFIDVKHFAGPPLRSLDYVLSCADLSNLRLIAINGLLLYGFLSCRRLFPKSSEEAVPLAKLAFLARRIHHIPLLRTLMRIAVRLTGKASFRNVTSLEKELRRFDTEIVLVEHHLSHAGSAYYSAPWLEDDKDTLILTLDMAGDGLFATASIGSHGNIHRIASSPVAASLGTLYSATTNYLGLKMLEDEFKVMGLSSYGDPSRSYEVFSKLVKLPYKNPMQFEASRVKFGKSRLSKRQPDWYLSRAFARMTRDRRSSRRFDNVAAGLQAFTEDIVVQWVHNCIKQTGIARLALAGGVFLNVKLNKRLLEDNAVEDIFVYPASSDAGGAVGAAFEGYRYVCERDGKKFRPRPLKELYLGPEFSTEEVDTALKGSKGNFKVEHYSDIEPIIAEWVAEGHAVGRFNGRMEFGPRALGNRSILARADDINMIKHLNLKVKQRTWWMPFSPTILEQRSKDYLVRPRPSPYMILLFDTTPRRREIAAATHPYDGTCRPQTLDESWNPSYYRILEKYEQITGYAGFLNTSFNLHGHTMVCTPQQAIWTFLNSGLDILAISSYALRKN